MTIADSFYSPNTVAFYVRMPIVNLPTGLDYAFFNDELNGKYVANSQCRLAVEINGGAAAAPEKF